MYSFSCNVCRHDACRPYLNQGPMPIAHHLYKAGGADEYQHPYELVQCTHCNLVQIDNPIDPKILYAETDSYLTGFQKPKHIDELIATICSYDDPGKALDIGCNDGSLLQKLKNAGFTGLVGIEPCKPAAEAAQANGFSVYDAILSRQAVDTILKEHGTFNIIMLRHVLEHISDVEDAMSLMYELLADDGLLVIELPEIEQAFKTGNNSVLWEEHVNYFTQPYVQNMLPSFGFEVLAKRNYVFGGGSFALVSRKQAKLEAIDQSTFETNASLLDHFPAKYQHYKESFAELMKHAKEQQHTICLYGAAPRSCCVLNGLQLASEVDVVIDDRSDIQHFILPGIQKEIRALDKAAADIHAPVLCLLGVGADKEHLVKSKMVELTKGKVVFVSLFPQRDTLKSAQDALESIRSNASANIEKTA